MRLFVAALLFAGMIAALALAPADTLSAQDKKGTKKKAQPKVDPKTFIPDAATLKQIKDKTEELRKAIAALKAKKIDDDVLIEVEIYLKAAENIVRFEEWLHANSIKWTFATLEQGLARAEELTPKPFSEGGKAVWRDVPGEWSVRAYRSKIDNSIQPYAVLLPADYGVDPEKKWRLDVVLHGRDSSLTEAKFIATHRGSAPKDLGHIQVEVYGRGNNAYRWAGETDVFEVLDAHSPRHSNDRVVLQGFSMGGAGTWHIGLHHPERFCVIGPGAGFTTTHGYISNLPKQLPEYQEKCLRIYDAVDYAENVFNVPVVAYSGEKDAQKKAADNIENALKGFKEPFKFTHLIAPGLEHQMPKSWQEKAEAEYRKYADRGRDPNPKRVRFVTYTPKYNSCDWLRVDALETTYQKAVVDVTRDGNHISMTTSNVRRLALRLPPGKYTVTADGRKLALEATEEGALCFEKQAGRWVSVDGQEAVIRATRKPEKEFFMHGPIDDAFTNSFTVVGPTRDDGYPTAALKQFAGVWDRYFRGTLPTSTAAEYERLPGANLVLFGTPDSNPLIAKALPKLPITWTKDELVVNGVKYNSKTHVPVLIYPNPLTYGLDYIVLNSGHTFKEADLKGTNALLYPRLGDWAVTKPTPTAKDPAAYEVVAAGLFDENWQFPKKK